MPDFHSRKKLRPFSWQIVSEDVGNISPSKLIPSLGNGPLSPLPPARWSRGNNTHNNLDNNYTFLETQPDSPKNMGRNANQKSEPQVSITAIEYPSYSDIVISEQEKGLSKTLEMPKVAIRRGLRGNWSKLLLHIVAAGVTVGVCQLSFRNIYWMDLRPPSEPIALGITQGGILNFLQLAAKLHELLILASISSIVLHAVQAHLTGQRGLPLGMMANAFELGSGQFLRRRSFWSSLWTVDPATGKRFPYTYFWLLSIFCTILVTLAGPSSAIAVIPTLNYFDLPKPFNQPVLPYYVLNETTELWPTRLTAGSLNAPNSGNLCNDPTSFVDQDSCPSGGFSATYDWAGGLLFSDSDLGTNISFPDPSGSTRRVLTAQSCNSTFDGRASAVTLNGFITNALKQYWIFAQSNFHGAALQAAQPHMAVDENTEVYAPRVETMCTSYANYDFDPDNPNDQPNMTFPSYSSNPISVPDWAYKFSRPVNASNFTFVEIPTDDPLAPSLGAVLIVPLIENINGTWVQTTENVACSIYSQWVPVSVWYEPTMNDQVSYQIITDLQDTCLTIPTTPTPDSQPINNTISTDYANAINEELIFVSGTMPALYAAFQLFVFNESIDVPNGVIFKAPIPVTLDGANVTDQQARQQRAKLISTVLAGFTTDGLARDAGNAVFPYSSSMFLLPNLTADEELQGRFPFTSAVAGQDIPLNTTSMKDVSNWLRLDPKFQRYGYGYRWQGSRTTQFGISVLLVHIAVTIVYLTFLVADFLGPSGGVGIPKTWETIPEMIALAVNSRPSQILRNTAAGISEDRTFGEAVAVRETSVGHLEMIVGREEFQHMGQARPGLSYG